MTLTYKESNVISMQQPRKCSDELLKDTARERTSHNQNNWGRIDMRTRVEHKTYIVTCGLKVIRGLEWGDIVSSSCMLRQ